MEALRTDNRELIGLERDAEALVVARERAPEATLLQVDLLSWLPPENMVRSVGLVAAGGDLLPLFLADDELALLMQLAARLVADDGLFAIDATRIDPVLFKKAARSQAWGVDGRWPSANGGVVVRESRLLPDPLGRPHVAQLQIRHAQTGADEYVDEREPFSVRAWSSAEIEEAASAAGFEIISRLSEDRFRWVLRSTHA